MSIDKDTVLKVANLARLDLPEDRVEPMARELSSILDWIEQLGEVDVTGVDAMASTVEVALPMRDDVLSTDELRGGRPKDIVANAPKTEDNFFIVPKVVE